MRQSGSSLFSAFCAAIASLLLTPAGIAQTPTPADSSAAPTLRVYAREVQVDVDVTDANGQAVHGLTKADFTVLDDGRPVNPDNFREHRSDQDGARAQANPILSPNVFTNVGITESARPLTLLLVDSLDTPMTTQAIVQKRLLDFVAKMAPGTQVAVFKLSTLGQLSLIQGFTSDPAVLASAIKSRKFGVELPTLEDYGQEPNSTTGQISMAQGNDKVAAAVQNLNENTSGEPTRFDADVECEHAASRGQYTFHALSQIAAYVSGMPGRKSLVWFTGLFPQSMSGKQGTQCFDFRNDFRTVGERLGHANVVIYPIDPRALDMLASQDPSSRIIRLQNVEELRMEALAEDSGGKAFYHTNDLAGAMAQAVDAGSNYYRIAFAPTNPVADTRLRRIKITVDKPDLKLTYRTAYHAIAPGDTLSGQTINTATPLQAAMLRGALPVSEIPFSVSVAQAPDTEATLPPGNNADPKQMKPPYRRLTLSYAIDAAGLQFGQSQDGTYHAQFEYAVNVYDAENGKLLNTSVLAARPSLQPAVYQSIVSGGAKLRLQIDAPAKGNYILRVAVHDQSTDRVGAVEIPSSAIQAAPAAP